MSAGTIEPVELADDAKAKAAPAVGAAAVVAPTDPPAAPATSAGVEQVIRATHGWVGINWAEMWRFRELLYFLIWRDFKVRYKQTALGVAWAILVPLLNTVVLTIVFGKFAKIPSDGFPYAVFVYAAQLPWTFFATGVNLGGQSLVNQSHLLTKVYFPRLFVPTASVGAGLVDFAISCCVFAVMLACYRQVPSVGVVFLPGLVLLTLAATLGLAFALAALTVTYRDFRYVIPFMLQLMMWASPVIYPISLFDAKWRWIIALNPMAGIIDGYRSAILGKPWDFLTLGVSSATAILLLVVGLLLFRKTERRFADIA